MRNVRSPRCTLRRGRSDGLVGRGSASRSPRIPRSTNRRSSPRCRSRRPPRSRPTAVARLPAGRDLQPQRHVARVAGERRDGRVHRARRRRLRRRPPGRTPQRSTWTSPPMSPASRPGIRGARARARPAASRARRSNGTCHRAFRSSSSRAGNTSSDRRRPASCRRRDRWSRRSPGRRSLQRACAASQPRAQQRRRSTRRRHVGGGGPGTSCRSAACRTPPARADRPGRTRRSRRSLRRADRGTARSSSSCASCIRSRSHLFVGAEAVRRILRRSACRSRIDVDRAARSARRAASAVARALSSGRNSSQPSLIARIALRSSRTPRR